MHNEQTTAKTYPNQEELVLHSGLQYGEPMASTAINKHMHNVASHGIYVGFDYKLAGGMKVILSSEGERHTLVARHKKSTLTIHAQHPFTIDVPAGGEYFIVVDSFYNYGVKTKQVDIRSDIDAANYKVITESELLDHHVILVSFTVPSEATELTDEMASIERRSTGGWGIEEHENRYNPHPQYLHNDEHATSQQAISGNSLGAWLSPKRGVEIFVSRLTDIWSGTNNNIAVSQKGVRDGLDTKLDNTATAVDSEKFNGKTANHYLQLDRSRGAFGGMNGDGISYLFVRTSRQGILPHSPAPESQLGTSSWQFKSVHVVTAYEDGIALNKKYLGIDATAKDTELLNNKTNAVEEAPSTIVERDSEGDVSARSLRTSLPAQTTALLLTDEMAFRRDSENDNHMRHIGRQEVRNWIGHASLSESGLTQLSNSISGTSEEVAATEKAVAAAYQCGENALRLANDHTDEKFNQLLGNAPADALNTLAQLSEKMSNNKDDIVVLTTSIAEKVPLTRRINTVGAVTGGSDLKGDLTIGIKDASTTQKGAVQLTEDIESSSGILAVSARGLKKLYDIVKTKITKEDGDGWWFSKSGGRLNGNVLMHGFSLDFGGARAISKFGNSLQLRSHDAYMRVWSNNANYDITYYAEGQEHIVHTDRHPPTAAAVGAHSIEEANTLFLPKDGTATNAETLDGRDSASFSNRLSLGGIPDHQVGVVLLHKLNNTSISEGFFFQGQISLRRVNNLYAPTICTISSGKVYDTDKPSVGFTKLGSTAEKINIQTCMYQGSKWLCLLVHPSAAQVNAIFVTGEWDTPPRKIIFFDEKTNTPLNEEIATTIDHYTTYQPFSSEGELQDRGSPVYSRRNKPTHTEIGALGVDESAADSKLLGGLDPSAYMKKSESGLHTRVWGGTGSANEKQRYEIGRFTIDTKNWTSSSVIIVELFNTYYLHGGYKKYIVKWGYNQSVARIELVEAFGQANKEKLTAGEPVTISGNIKYISLFVEQSNYNRCAIKLTTAFAPTTANPPARSQCYLFDSPPKTVISSFTPEETVVNERNQQFNGNVHLRNNLTVNNYGLGSVGLYNSERFQNVFSMGVDANNKSIQYTMHPDGTSLNNFYGIGWTHSNNPNSEGKKISGHHAIFCRAGKTKSAVGDHLWTIGNVYERGQALSERYLGKNANAVTATKLLGNRNNYKGTTDESVVGQLMWSKYGNHHTIFDASNSKTPTNVTKSNIDPDDSWKAGYPTLMGYNGDKTYGVRVDIARTAENLGGIKPAGFSRIYSGSAHTGSGDWTTAEFVAWLKGKGCFNQAFWMMKGSWSYASNKRITDTGIGHIHLAGCVIEVMGVESAYTIRVTTPTTSVSSGVTNAQFTYVNHGSGYEPSWRRDYNTKNPPPTPHIEIPDNRWQVKGSGSSQSNLTISSTKSQNGLGNLVTIIDTKIIADRTTVSTPYSEHKDLMAVVSEVRSRPGKLPSRGTLSIYPVVRSLKKSGESHTTYSIYVYVESSHSLVVTGASFRWTLLQYKDWNKAQPL